MSESEYSLLLQSIPSIFGALLSGIFGIIGVLLGLWIARKRDHESKVADNTIQLYKEFFSQPLQPARVEADQFLIPNKGKNFQDLYKGKEARRMDPVWDVLEFYDRLLFHIDNNQVDNALACRAFGEIFVYWYHIYFREGLRGTGWEREERMAQLYGWFEQQGGSERFKHWVHTAEKNYSELASPL